MTETEQIREAIRESFRNLPIPNGRSILTKQDRTNAAGAEEFRRAIAGKNWQSLTPEFLKEWWASFCYLSPDAYCYYLPALLDWAIDAAGDDPMHTVLFSIVPSSRSLYYDGIDSEFQNRQVVFSRHQYRTVCRFLGFAFDHVPRVKHDAAQALRWGWFRIDTPELSAVKRYYEELHSFSYTEPDDPEAAELYCEIQTAFADTPYPGDNQLCGSDQDDEPAEYALELRGVKWKSAHPDLLAICYTALSFLSDVGFRYLLPAFLIAELCGFESNASPEFHLTHGLYDARIYHINLNTLREIIDAENGELKWVRFSVEEALRNRDNIRTPNSDFNWRQYSVNRFAPFNHQERIAIIHYLEYKALNNFEAIGVNEALESYWRPSAR